MAVYFELLKKKIVFKTMIKSQEKSNQTVNFKSCISCSAIFRVLVIQQLCVSLYTAIQMKLSFICPKEPNKRAKSHPSSTQFVLKITRKVKFLRLSICFLTKNHYAMGTYEQTLFILYYYKIQMDR